ncbi:MAG: hypothetical protein ABIS27_11425 [Longimicrobiales bacterium]
MNIKHYGLLTAVAVIGLSSGACDSLGLNDDEATVGLTFASRSGGTSALMASLVQDSITVGGHTLNLTNVDLVISEATLEVAEASGGDDSDSEADSDSDGRMNEKFRDSRFTLALPLNGGVITPFTTQVQLGTYEELELDVDSVRLRGTYDGQPFDVTMNVNTELEFDFSPPFVIASADDRFNVSVLVNTTNWLRNNDGSLVDPRTILTNTTTRASVMQRIKSSFKAFEDSDKDADEQDSDSDG